MRRFSCFIVFGLADYQIIKLVLIAMLSKLERQDKGKNEISKTATDSQIIRLRRIKY